MKKIIGLTVAALMVMGLVGGGTWAYFSDIETSSGNYLAAGTLDLDLNGVDTGVTFLTYSSLYPGDTGGNYTEIKNSGSIDAELEIDVTVVDVESTGTTEFEADSNNGSSGELGAYLTVAMFIDTGDDGAFTSGNDYGLKSDGTVYTSGSAQYATIDSYNGQNWTNAYGTINMTSNQDDRFYVLYNFPAGVTDNYCQGDSANVTITFTLEQAEVD
jgi:spore coat-associated protein N